MEADRGALYLGLDLGTSSLKAVAIDESGRALGSASAAYPTLGAGSGRAEQDPSAWMAAMEGAVRALSAEGLDLSRAEGIGLSAQMPTFVGTDESGAPLGPAILWSDPRADGVGARLLEAWGPERHYRTTGVVLDGRYIAPMYEWFLENRPEASRPCAMMLSAKDYLCLRLTGRARTDPSTASGFGLYSLASGAWDEGLCAEAGIDARLLPSLAGSGEAVGGLSREAASALGLRAGIPVACGAADSVAGVLGMGALEPGLVCQMAGSSTAIVAVAEGPFLDDRRRYLVTPLARAGTYGLEADILATGSSLAWLASILEGGGGSEAGAPSPESLGRLARLAAEAPPGADGLLFFPYLAGGEQSVLWDPSLRGGLSGLGLRHGPAHLARALYESLCYEARRCVEAFRDSGFRPARMLCTGPISRDPFYLRLLADVAGLDCEASAAWNSSALGAALLAGIGAGAFGFERLASMLPPRPEPAATPDPAARAAYDGLYAEYLAASSASRRGPV